MQNEDQPRMLEERATQTSANDNSWLVRGITFSIRIFLVFIIAFARAVIIVAGDSYNDNVFDQVFPLAQASITPSGWTTGSSETHQARTTSAPDDQRSSPSSQVYYVVFIGREVGYTTSSSLMTSLVNGVPNNYSRGFSTLDDAFQAYAEAVMHGNVRRVRAVIQPSGHVELMYEHMSLHAGIRNLDAPHLPAKPLTSANTQPGSQPPAPFKAESCVNLHASETTSSVSSVGSATESNGLGIPVVSTLERESPGGQGTLTVILLDSDGESSHSADLMNNSAATMRSAHSSDVFYADEAYDRAFAAYIEEEDSKASGVEAEASNSCVLPE